VAKGTAKRIAGALDDPGGAPVAIGGKTGTGDNRRESRSTRGALVASRVVNRTATFVFYLGERHFGTLTAYVPGPQAQGFRFTSALPVQILKSMAPLLRPAIGGAAGCPAGGVPGSERLPRQQTAALRP